MERLSDKAIEIINDLHTERVVDAIRKNKPGKGSKSTVWQKRGFGRFGLECGAAATENRTSPILITVEGEYPYARNGLNLNRS